MRGWLVVIVDAINVRAIQCYFALLRIHYFFFFVGQTTWKALQPRGETCLVADLGEKSW